MLKAFRFVALWLYSVAFLQQTSSYDASIPSSTNLEHNIKSECSAFLTLFAESTRQFNLCAVRHAKPLRFCRNCLGEYRNLTKRDPVKFNDSRCVEDLVKSERFQIVMRVYDFQTGLWDAAHCKRCYDTNWKLTYHTVEFFKRLHLVAECFKNHTTISVNGTVNRSELCYDCRPYYEKLRGTFNRLLEETEDDDENLLCADIMSAMNDTRQDWRNYKCPNKNDPNFTVLSLTGLLILSTLVYYCGVRKHEKYRQKVQSRSRSMKKEINYDSE